MSEAAVVSRPAPRAMVALRFEPGEPALAEAIERAVGCGAPGRRRIVFGPLGAAAWMAPDEVLLFAEAGRGAEVCAALGAALGVAHHLAVDVSDARTLFRIEGRAARETLAKGAPVDLAPDAFGPGDFRRSRLGQVAAAFWATQDGALELMVQRSVADHVALWLAEAARPGRSAGLS